MNPRKRPNYSKMTEHIESAIAGGGYRAGEKLPTLRQLTSKFNLTGYAVHQGLRHLSEKGLIVLRHGSGAYVAASRHAAGPSNWNVTVFSNFELAAGVGYLFCALLGVQAAAMKLGCTVTIRKRDYYQYHLPEPPLETMIGDAHGLIFLGEYDYLTFQPPSTMPSSGLEMTDTCGGVLSPISLDPIAAAHLAVDFFRRRGKRRVKVFHLAGGPAFELRAECFRFLWSRHGEVEICPYPLGRELPLDAFIERDPEVGLLFCSGSWCEDYIRTCARLGCGNLTEKFAVLAIDGKSQVMPDFHPVSTIAIDWRAAGEAALYDLVRRLENPSAEARRIFLVPQLHEI